MSEEKESRICKSEVLALPVAVQLGFAFLIAIGADADAIPMAISGSIPYWAGVVIILARRWNRITPGDRLFAKYAFFLFVIIGLFFTVLWGALAWRHPWIRQWLLILQ